MATPGIGFRWIKERGGPDFIGSGHKNRHLHARSIHFHTLDLPGGPSSPMLEFGGSCRPLTGRDHVWLLKTCLWHRSLSPSCPSMTYSWETLSSDNAVFLSESRTWSIFGWEGNWSLHVLKSFSSLKICSSQWPWVNHNLSLLFGFSFGGNEMEIIATQKKKMIQDLPMKDARWSQVIFLFLWQLLQSCFLSRPSH